jgi:hypothetical protein
MKSTNKRGSKRARRPVLSKLRLYKTVSLARIEKRDTYTVSTAIYAWAAAVSVTNNFSTVNTTIIVNFNLFNNSSVNGQNSTGLYANAKFLKDCLLYGFYAVESALVVFHPNKLISTTLAITSLPPLSLNVALPSSTYSEYQEYDTKNVLRVDFTETENEIQQLYTIPGIFAQTGTGFPIMGSQLWLTTQGISSISSSSSRDLQLFIGQDISGTNVVTVGSASSQVGIVDVIFRVKWCHPQNIVAI